MSTKKRKQAEPREEFYIVVSRDVSLSDLQDLKDTCSFYEDGDSALADAAVEANPGEDEDGFAQVIYRVQKFVEVK